MSSRTAPSFSRAATSYLTTRAIDPATAYRVGVREDRGAIVWPTVDADGKPSPRRRRLAEGPGPKCRGAYGRTLGCWWPCGAPTAPRDVLVAEGESDALAAVCALRSAPWARTLAVASLPGASFPSRVLIAALRKAGASVAALAFDGDLAGGMAADRVAWDLVAAGIGARILPVEHGEDLASTLVGESDRAEWLRLALIAARPIGLRQAALRAENRWLRAMCWELAGELSESLSREHILTTNNERTTA